MRLSPPFVRVHRLSWCKNSVFHVSDLFLSFHSSATWMHDLGSCALTKRSIMESSTNAIFAYGIACLTMNDMTRKSTLKFIHAKWSVGVLSISNIITEYDVIVQKTSVHESPLNCNNQDMTTLTLYEFHNMLDIYVYVQDLYRLWGCDWINDITYVLSMKDLLYTTWRPISYPNRMVTSCVVEIYQSYSF